MRLGLFLQFRDKPLSSLAISCGSNPQAYPPSNGCREPFAPSSHQEILGPFRQFPVNKLKLQAKPEFHLIYLAPEAPALSLGVIEDLRSWVVE